MSVQAMSTAAGMSDAVTTAELLDRIASKEEWLRYLALSICTDRGSLSLRGHWYPWTNVIGKPPVLAARQRLEMAYAHEREIAQSALAGLP